MSGAAAKVKIAGAGAAGLAVVFAVAPMAHAAPSAKPGKPTPATAAKKPAAKAAPAATKRVVAVEPNYGFQKYRVGVQVKSGAYVPAGTTTAGTEVTVTDTTPATPGNPASTNTFTCTTDASTAQSGSTATFCKVPANIMQSQRAKLTKMANARTSLTVTPTPSGAPSDEQFFAAPGHTITLKQKTVNANLVIDPAIATIQPCEPPFPGFPACGTFGGETFEPKSTDVIFDDAGLPPKAVNDSAKTDAGKSVTIDVTRRRRLRRTPGTDTFCYTITTANGSDDHRAGAAGCGCRHDGAGSPAPSHRPQWPGRLARTRSPGRRSPGGGTALLLPPTGRGSRSRWWAPSVTRTARE